ncbi:MAG: hypothetical protein ACI4JS_08590 [Oscillospiraceae bacterium]
MLYKFRTKAEALTLSSTIPSEVLSHIINVCDILDDNYNSHGIDGGYILVAESVQDLLDIKAHHLDYTTEPIELRWLINGYISVLYLPATEYSVTVVLPQDIAPTEMMEGGFDNV